MTPQLTAPLTCVLPSQQDGPLRTQRERDWSETGGCVSFPSVTTQDSTTQHSALLSLLPALGQGSNDSSEGQLWPPKLALLTAAPRVAHTLPPTPSTTSSLFQRLGWGSLWFHPQARNVLVSSKAEVPLHCQKHKQAQLPETELLVPGVTVNTPGKGP